MRGLRFVIAVASAVAALGFGSVAEAVVLDAVDLGSYNNRDGHFPFPKWYMAGVCPIDLCEQPVVFNNFFVFDLQGLGPVSSATLRLDNGQSSGTVTFTVFDVTTPIPSLVASTGGYPDDAIFADLGSGTAFGSVVVDQPSGLVSIGFNATGVAAINASRGGLFAVGGAVTNNPSVFGYVFLQPFFGTMGSAQLEVDSAPVPEPASLLTLGVGLLGLGLRKRRA